MYINGQESISNEASQASSVLISRVNRICSNCCGADLQLRTVRKNGIQYYYCKYCFRARKPIEVDKNGQRMILVCPNCEGYIIRKGVSSNKKQRYYCHDCDKSTLSPKICRERLEKIEKFACINCKSTKLKKRGFDRLKNQVYYCSDCKHRSINTIIVYIDVLVKEPVDKNTN